MLFNGSAFERDNDDGGTDTGRSSAVDPAVQTIPKHNKWAKKLRKCYPAPDGYRFFQADFSQGELRIAACAANDETMIDAYLTGKDLHCVTGAKLAQMEFEEFMALECSKKKEAMTKAELQAMELFAKFRQRAKPANFGLLYGMQAESFRQYAYVSTDGKMDLTLEEAEKVRNAFFELYAKLLEWHESVVAFARQNGWIDNPLGRVAHLPLIDSRVWKVKSKQERKAINSPIQSTLSDLCMWAIAFLEERYASEGLWMAGMTHDSIYGYYPEKDGQELWYSRIVETMETLPYREVFDWNPQLDFPADFEDGSNLADLEKVKRAA
jgi:DNA polymerase I-like protein with 3'-5' exonuclease and polymerase domains